jgi:hypothetical protein
MTCPSLCIHRVCNNTTKKNVYNVLNKLNFGLIDHIDIVYKGKEYKQVFIHFKTWFQNKNATKAKERIMAGKDINVIYEGPWFWKMSLSRSNYKQ